MWQAFPGLNQLLMHHFSHSVSIKLIGAVISNDGDGDQLLTCVYVGHQNSKMPLR